MSDIIEVESPLVVEIKYQREQAAEARAKAREHRWMCEELVQALEAALAELNHFDQPYPEWYAVLARAKVTLP